ncbi:hypothetical protein CK203_109868 [Vitis vinifera]|uniref:Uncharacterized protein n=1 Tax=Vitis vinifera TaxID=29760 RepID=A0A438E539_VITVI|nr:hypothetical protein CK203_109868 [Vitis vinifera]
MLSSATISFHYSTGCRGEELCWRHYIGYLRGFFFGPHHLIMAALLYFEEKVHQKKLLRADAIPLLFPSAEPGPQWSRASRDSTCRAATGATPIETPADTRAPAPVVPSAEPIPEPSSSAEPRTTISISEYRALCHTLQTLTTSQSTLTQEMAALRAHQEQIIATQTQHTAILRQIQSHLGIPSAPQHQMPAPLEPTEPTPGDTQTST